MQHQCENTKRNLSIQNDYTVDIDMLFDGKDLQYNFTRENFEKLNRDLFDRTLNCVEKTLKDAKLTKNDIQEIVLVGGSSRIPCVRYFFFLTKIF